MEVNHSPLKIQIFFPSFGNNKISSVFSGSCCRHSTRDKGREGISNSNPSLLNSREVCLLAINLNTRLPFNFLEMKLDIGLRSIAVSLLRDSTNSSYFLK